jgi:hypothetical protein
MSALCVYGNHIVDMHRASLCAYTDLENGVAENTPICPDCYLKHLQKYYPNSRATKILTEEAENLVQGKLI